MMAAHIFGWISHIKPNVLHIAAFKVLGNERMTGNTCGELYEIFIFFFGNNYILLTFFFKNNEVYDF